VLCLIKVSQPLNILVPVSPEVLVLSGMLQVASVKPAALSADSHITTACPAQYRPSAFHQNTPTTLHSVRLITENRAPYLNTSGNAR
jgi:hypothetical protein